MEQTKSKIFTKWNILFEYSNMMGAKLRKQVHQAEIQRQGYQKENDVKEYKVERFDESLNAPYTWKEPRLVFINKKPELFNIVSQPRFLPPEDKFEEVVFFKRLFKIMNETPQHTYHINIKYFDERYLQYTNLVNFSDNIIVGLQIDRAADIYNIEGFLKVPSKYKCLYVDFMTHIANIEFDKFDNKIEWVEINWNEKKSVSEDSLEAIKELKQNCDNYNIPFYFKSWGNTKNNPNPNDPTMNPEHRYYDKAGCMFEGKIYYYDPVTKTKAPKINLFGNEYYVMDDFKGYQSIWELKSYLPMMQEDLYQSLKEDIRINGLNDPILYYVTNDGVKLIIEGHTRLKACIELNLQDFPTKEIKEDFYSLEDIKLWMLKHQFQRRNLSSIERLELAYLSKDIIEKQAKENLIRAGKGDDINNAIDTNTEIANLAGVGRTTVVYYGGVLKSNSKSIIDKMKKGDISISSAYKRVKEKPSNPKSETIIPEITYMSSFDEAKEFLKSGMIEGILVLDNEDKANILTNAQRSKLGVLLIK